ncbi:MAG: hypothetical protein JWO00_369 [Candidatus Parcubacteria bacterium]|nr:hypothetical protein [Candidatus Parcubacteria bacterium]
MNNLANYTDLFEAVVILVLLCSLLTLIMQRKLMEEMIYRLGEHSTLKELVQRGLSEFEKDWQESKRQLEIVKKDPDCHIPIRSNDVSLSPLNDQWNKCAIERTRLDILKTRAEKLFGTI